MSTVNQQELPAAIAREMASYIPNIPMLFVVVATYVVEDDYRNRLNLVCDNIGICLSFEEAARKLIELYNEPVFEDIPNSTSLRSCIRNPFYSSSVSSRMQYRIEFAKKDKGYAIDQACCIGMMGGRLALCEYEIDDNGNRGICHACISPDNYENAWFGFFDTVDELRTAINLVRMQYPELGYSTRVIENLDSTNPDLFDHIFSVHQVQAGYKAIHEACVEFNKGPEVLAFRTKMKNEIIRLRSIPIINHVDEPMNDSDEKE